MSSPRNEGSRPVLETFVQNGRTFFGLFRQRLRDRRFWAVQSLVVGITIAHSALEHTEVLGRHEALSFVPVSFYLVPVLYAGLNFGIEGALPTALWSGLLAVPNAIVWHDSLQRVGELFQMGVLVTVAVVVAQRVDREAMAKQRAEQMSARLAELNATAAAASQSLEPCQVVRETLGAIVRQGKVDLAWIASASGDLGLPSLSVVPRSPAAPAGLPEAWEKATRDVAGGGQSWLHEEEGAGGSGRHGVSAMVVPVQAAGERIGALGLGSYESSLSREDLSLLDAMAHQLAVALANSRHYQDAKNALDELASAQENLRAYLRLATEAQEEERKRLARELHDETLQSLVVIKGSLDTLAAGNRSSSAVKAGLAAIRQMIETTVDEVRHFSRDLRPSMLDDLGLVHAVDWLTSDMARRTAIKARLAVEGEARRLSVDTELAAYRILQEALHNVERHSGASNVNVVLTFASEQLIARVADDGSGFDLGHVLGGHGNEVPLGLIGMQERAKLVGGSLEIETQPQKGTRVTVTLLAQD